MANTNGPRVEQIRQSAYELLNEKGLQGLSMRALADRLHIKAPSLYKHVKDRDEIIADLQERGLIEFATALSSAPPNKRGQVMAFRTWALANPHLYEVTLRIPLMRDRLPEGLEGGITAMVIAMTGKSHEHARAVWALVHGLIDLELMGRFPDDADLEGTWDEALAMIG